ncbi:MAG: hypothetical protein V4713_09755 [Pseudomonadota bacterium]
MKTGIRIKRRQGVATAVPMPDGALVRKTGVGAVRRVQVLAFLLGFAFATTGTGHAQSTEEKATMPMSSASMPMTRDEVKRDRDEFLRTHRWDEETSDWVRKDGRMSPTGTKSRAQVKAERDEFLRTNKYDINNDAWVALKGTPRDMGQMSREEVKMETREFLRTHRWDDEAGKWVEYNRARMKR